MGVALKPKKRWWTADEFAAASLPDVPTTRQGVDKKAKQMNWRAHSEFARPRQGRGGGWEYSWEVLPVAAQKSLLAEAKTQKEQPDKPTVDRDEAWSWFEGLTDRVKEKAASRLRIIQTVEAFQQTGMTRFNAVTAVARIENISDRTIWNWLAMIEFTAPEDRLPYLAPRHKAAVRKDKKVACSPEFFDKLKADFLRLERPSFTSSHRRTVKLAKANGWNTLPERTARRRLNQLVPRVSQIFAREGVAGLARCFPPQTRDKSTLHALEAVNADCHKIDVFVLWPDGEIVRPQIVGFQDIYSGKILSWRVDLTPNKVAVMSAFGDVVQDYGIPERCLFDNGTEFANKWLTGQSPTRFRFKVKEDEPLGVLPQLGIKIHWATPGHGQAKPIERAFRDIADDIAKDPRFAGAYVGHKPDAKPENYGSRAVPFEEFLPVLAEGIEEHNARAGRRSDVCDGRSFDQTFAQSYANAKIRKATQEQSRLWLMGQEVLTMNRGHGLVKLHKSEYYSDWMAEFAGQKIVARFDPENLHDGLHIYSLDGEYMGFAACKLKSEFFNLADARAYARQKSQRLRAERALLKTLRPTTPRELAAELDAVERNAPPTVESKVVRGMFGQSNSKIVERPEYEPELSEEDQAKHAAFVASFPKPEDLQPTPEETPQDRFAWALELEARLEAEIEVTAEEMRRYRGYVSSSEYRGHKAVYEEFKRAEAQ